MTHFSVRAVLHVVLACVLCASAVGCKPAGDKASGPGSTSDTNPPASAPAASQ